MLIGRPPATFKELLVLLLPFFDLEPEPALIILEAVTGFLPL
jgi:uncharacterized membrane protein